MTSLLGIVPFIAVLLLFSWFYRIASRQVLRYSVAWKLIILFFVVLVPLGVVVGQLAPFEIPLVRLVFGIVCQLAAGAFFIGMFAVSKEGIRPGMLLGLKVTALSMAYQLMVVGALFALAAALQTVFRPS